MKNLLDLVISFLPFIAFAALAGHSLLRLEMAIVACLALTLLVNFKQLRQGFILAWGMLAFFSTSAVFTIVLKNIWFMTHLGILAPATLAAVAWVSLWVGRPFVLQIARQSTPEDRWNTPQFTAACRYMTKVWGWLFVFSTLVAAAQFFHAGLPHWMYSTLSTGSTLGGIAYTEWFKYSKRKNRELQGAAQTTA